MSSRPVQVHLVRVSNTVARRSHYPAGCIHKPRPELFRTARRHNPLLCCPGTQSACNARTASGTNWTCSRNPSLRTPRQSPPRRLKHLHPKSRKDSRRTSGSDDDAVRPQTQAGPPSFSRNRPKHPTTTEAQHRAPAERDCAPPPAVWRSFVGLRNSEQHRSPHQRPLRGEYRTQSMRAIRSISRLRRRARRSGSQTYPNGRVI